MKEELNFQKQNKLHNPEKGINGNCMITCLANLMGLKVEDCPPIEELMHTKKPNGFWWDVLLLWLEKMGYFYNTFSNHEEVMKVANGAYYLVSGKSPRYPDSYHIVIYKNGQMVFDPHPDNTGILTEEYFELLVKNKL